MGSVSRASRRMPLRGGWPRTAVAAPVARTMGSVRALRRPTALVRAPVSRVGGLVRTVPAAAAAPARVQVRTPSRPPIQPVRPMVAPVRRTPPSPLTVPRAMIVRQVALQPFQLLKEQVIWSHSARFRPTAPIIPDSLRVHQAGGRATPKPLFGDALIEPVEPDNA